MDSYYSVEELKELGLKKVGNDVRLSRKASLYSVNEISIGNHVRIDDFCILSGKIDIGNYVHVNPFCGIFAGSAGVSLDDFANLASRITIYAISDDYSGETLTSPLIPEQFKKLRREHVHIGKYVIIGTGTSILPGVTIEEGSAIGAMSLVTRNTKSWGIYAGTPIKLIKERSRNMLNLLKEFQLNE